MKASFSNTEFSKNVTHDAFGHRTSVDFGNSTECQFYIRGCSIRGQTYAVSTDCRLYKVASSNKGGMLACRGYNGIR